MRYAVLTEYGESLAVLSSIEDAKTVLNRDIDEIEALAERVVHEEGYSHDVRVTFCREYYPTRVYDGFDLPAGEYTSLRILIGAGEGQNWFCMVYPPLCTASAESDEALLAAGFSQSQVRLLTENEGEYTLRFKVVEAVSDCYDTLKGWFSK